MNGTTEPRPWTTDEIERLRSMLAAGQSLTAAAAALGRSRGSASAICNKNGLRTHASIPMTTRERIRELTAQGWRASRIAKQVGVTIDAVVFYAGHSA